VPQPNGSQFVGQSSVPQVFVKAVIKVNPKSMVKTVRQIDQKGKYAIFKAKQNVGQNPHKIKVKPRGESMKKGTKECVDSL